MMQPKQQNGYAPNYNYEVNNDRTRGERFQSGRSSRVGPGIPLDSSIRMPKQRSSVKPTIQMMPMEEQVQHRPSVTLDPEEITKKRNETLRQVTAMANFIKNQLDELNEGQLPDLQQMGTLRYSIQHQPAVDGVPTAVMMLKQHNVNVPMILPDFECSKVLLELEVPPTTTMMRHNLNHGMDQFVEIGGYPCPETKSRERVRSSHHWLNFAHSQGVLSKFGTSLGTQMRRRIFRAINDRVFMKRKRRGKLTLAPSSSASPTMTLLNAPMPFLCSTRALRHPTFPQAVPQLATQAIVDLTNIEHHPIWQSSMCGTAWNAFNIAPYNVVSQRWTEIKQLFPTECTEAPIGATPFQSRGTPSMLTKFMTPIQIFAYSLSDGNWRNNLEKLEGIMRDLRSGEVDLPMEGDKDEGSSEDEEEDFISFDKCRPTLPMPNILSLGEVEARTYETASMLMRKCRLQDCSLPIGQVMSSNILGIDHRTVQVSERRVVNLAKVKVPENTMIMVADLVAICREFFPMWNVRYNPEISPFCVIERACGNQFSLKHWDVIRNPMRDVERLRERCVPVMDSNGNYRSYSFEEPTTNGEGKPSDLLDCFQYPDSPETHLLSSTQYHTVDFLKGISRPSNLRRRAKRMDDLGRANTTRSGLHLALRTRRHRYYWDDRYVELCAKKQLPKPVEKRLEEMRRVDRDAGLNECELTSLQYLLHKMRHEEQQLRHSYDIYGKFLQDVCQMNQEEEARAFPKLDCSPGVALSLGVTFMVGPREVILKSPLNTNKETVDIAWLFMFPLVKRFVANCNQVIEHLNQLHRCMDSKSATTANYTVLACDASPIDNTSAV